ncbi:hypothetical protein [Gimesia maris]|uniref:hypothetical protein n=1 Tax=Gimesia maris TaxID=122 RepID=UPI000E8D01D8|nr:hypothetical protein [Gimesia maris]HAW28549.1 hypothetical protein [Planctomycetaceae bacterium]|tara:strand:- start:7468 stop:7698 length:231 start_codon:yes stop_codon:yes gene_type:complete
MVFQTFDPDDEESFDKMRDLFSPAQVDQSVRQALQMCWMMLPQDKRNVDELEQQFRRIVDRALKNMRDDDQAFGEP